MPRSTRTPSAGAPSTRSTRSTRSSKSHRSAQSTDSAETAWTQASSVSQDNASTPELVGPAPTPETPSRAGFDDAQRVSLVHMDRMLRFARSAEMHEGLDALLSIVKYRDGERAADGKEDGKEDASSMTTTTTGYQSALSELDYLEGLFKKLRFSYKEQLTKETVVRRILELELPLLSAADIDAMVGTTEAERGRLQAIKTEARQQGAAAEAIIRDLAAERLYVAMAEREIINLPERMLHLRHRLARMKEAIRAELLQVDRVTAGGRLDDDDAVFEEAAAAATSAPGSAVTGATGATGASPASTYWCIKCSSGFHSEPFYRLHQALHNAPRKKAEDVDGGGNGNDSSSSSYLDAIPAFPMRKCRACDEMVPTLFVDDAPADETHEAFHARLRQEVARAQEALERTALHDEVLSDLALRAPTEEIVVRLEVDEADMADMAARVRAEADRQAAVEGEMAELLRRLRESVAGIRLEMTRIEEEAGRMVQCIEEGRTYMGRSLQEQAELFDLLLNEDDEMEE